VIAISSLEAGAGFGATGYTSTSTSGTSTTISSFLGADSSGSAPGSTHVLDEVQLYDQDPTGTGTYVGTVWYVTSAGATYYSYVDVTATGGTATDVSVPALSTIPVATYNW